MERGEGGVKIEGLEVNQQVLLRYFLLTNVRFIDSLGATKIKSDQFFTNMR